MRQQIQFSEREKQVIGFLIQGRSNKQIALALGVSLRTVEFHLSNIYAKLGVTSRTEAALKLSKTNLRESAGGELRESTVVEMDGSDHNIVLLVLLIADHYFYQFQKEDYLGLLLFFYGRLLTALC